MAELVRTLEGSTFVVSDRRGDIEAEPSEPQGLFQHDTRFLSRFVLTIDGKRPNVLSTDDLQYYQTQFFLVPSTGSVYVDADLSIIRKRSVGGGFHEELALYNHRMRPVDLVLRIEVASDFADLFEVKDQLAKRGEYYHRLEPDGHLVLGYRRERFVRETEIWATREGSVDERGLSFAVHIPPHGAWRTSIEVMAVNGARGAVHPDVKYAAGTDLPRPETGCSLDGWIRAAPRLVCSWKPLEATYQRSLVDLAALRFQPALVTDGAVPAAGLPWFMALFGRDSILTSYQALPFVPEMARCTLRVLGLRQGTRVDPFRDEEPGKILHESRGGELTAFEERPHSPYFGSADATPLWLILLDEYERWTGDVQLVRDFEDEARAALAWIDRYGDRDGDGYIEYERALPSGLVNQCWKDSDHSILFADGTPASSPRATCELQGYAYDAKRRTARLAQKIWGDEALATRLRREAAELKQRFNRDFWIESRGCFALALDGSKRKVDALTSNIGHLLWSGIVEHDKLDAIAHHLMSDALYSGWGVRTMATSEAGYNPVGYHVGTVWPHDNAFIALGLAAHGYRTEAARIALGILQAAEVFHHRLPEAFAGYPRGQTGFPVEYPTACSPQAWATGTPLLLLRVLLGMAPMREHLLVDPAVPIELERIELLDIPGRWGRMDAFGRGRVRCA